MKGNKGSITLFSVLSMLLITATLFALLEGCRRMEVSRFADLQTKTALEAAFANYNSCLWRDYRLLGTDISQMEKVMAKVGDGRNGDGVNMLRMKADKIEIERVKRLTDGEGMAFIECVSSYMRKNIAYESLKELYNQYDAIKNLMDTSQMDIGNIEDAIEGLESVENKEEMGSVGTAGTKIDIVAILEEVKNWQEKGVLELVLKDTDSVSEAALDFEQGVSKRLLEKGNMPISQSVDWTDRVLLQQYLQSYLSNYRDCLPERALSYELEFLLGRRSSDIENLKIVVAKLLAIRGAANFMCVVSNPEKVAKAEALAIMCMGASLNPALVQVIKIGLLTAWAFVESVLDVRALLAGKRIPWLKSDEYWTSNIENMAALTSEFAMAKECTYGVTYKGYLGILLLFEQEKQLAMHTMDLQEATIREKYGDMNFRIDAIVTQAEASIVYKYAFIFPFLEVVKAEDKWPNRVLGKSNYSYY